MKKKIFNYLVFFTLGASITYLIMDVQNKIENKEFKVPKMYYNSFIGNTDTMYIEVDNTHPSWKEFEVAPWKKTKKRR